MTVEVIVVDDCPDGSAEKTIATIGDPRIHYFRNPQPSGGHLGLGVPRNLGWPKARGELVHFFDDDDLIPKGHYADVKNVFARHNVGLVFGTMEGFGDNPAEVARENRNFVEGARRAEKAQRLGSKRALAARLLFQNLMFVWGAVIVRKSCLESVGGFNPELRIMEDVELYARIIRRFGCCYLRRSALRYQVGPSIMDRNNPDRQSRLDHNYRLLHKSYRKTYGTLDFYLLKIAARTVLA